MSIRTLTLAAILSVVNGISLGQTAHKFRVEDLQEDFKLLRAALEEAHAGIYWYRSKSEMDLAFDNSFLSLDHDMDELEFFRIIAPLISKIGCGHTWVASTDETQERIWNRGKVLPLKIKVLDRKSFCVQNNSRDSTSIQPGDEILSINDLSIDSLLVLSNKFSPGDGYIEVGKWRIMDNVFNQFFSLYLGQQDQYRIRLRTRDAEEKEISVEPLTLREINVISARRYPSTQEKDDQNIRLSFLESNSAALLRINEFSDWKHNEKKIRFEDELKNTFRKIDSSRTKNLIIDLRNNDGGNEKYGLLLFSYLTDEPFLGYKQIDFRTTRFSFRKYTDTGWFEYKLFKTMLRHRIDNDTTFVLINDKASQLHAPSKSPFLGNTYVITNRGSFSTTADFAAIAHFNRIATFVGEETGGSYLGNTSNYSFLMTLPNSKIKINIPVARYQTNVESGENFGRGTIPDVQVHYSIDDHLKGVDKEMAAIIHLIGRESQKSE